MIDIPRWTEVPDFFVWDSFEQASADPARRLTSDATQQEALVAETARFYVIPDQFGVVDGHVLVLPKVASTSIASLDEAFDAELHWLLGRTSEVVAAAYEANPLVAEHGECGCATAGQAHVHVLPVPRSISPTELRTVVDRVLERRMVGIERVVYRDAEFTVLEDVQALAGAAGATVVGRQLRVDDLMGSVDYPADARSASKLVQPYVYVSGPGVQFLSTHHFRSQFVREVVGVAVGLPGRMWNRWVNTSRDNMFATFNRLAPTFHRGAEPMYGFTPRAGQW